MPNTQSIYQPPSEVTVRFGDGAHSFLMWGGATLGELANRIGILGEFHDCKLLTIDVEFSTPRSRWIASTRPHLPLTH